MALVLADRVRETTTTTGTGSVTLAGAYTGFQTFSAAVGTGNSTYYTIANVGSGEWEVGIGTYSSGGNLLSRTTVLASSNGGSLVNFGAGAKDVFVTQPAERALYIASAGTGLESKVTAFTNGGIVYASSTSALATGSALAFDGTTLTATGNAIISDNSANDALRITQTGAGNALLVEDSTNPDATPFVIDASGNIASGLTGTNLSMEIYRTVAANLRIDSDGFNSTIQARSFSNNPETGPILNFARGRGTKAATTIVQSGDLLAQYRGGGSDGVQIIQAANIEVRVDGTPGTNDMPGRLVFSTTADGASSPTERMRISSTGQTTISGNAIISVTDNTNAALRITQLGTGNALLVEDSTNPDSSPFVIDSDGYVVAGHTAKLNSTVLGYALTETIGTDNQTAQSAVWRFSADTGGAGLSLYKSRSGTIGTNAVVQSNDVIGRIYFNAADGSGAPGYLRAAQIEAAVDGTPGTNDMPGRLVFSTTADGASSPTEAVRINSAQVTTFAQNPILTSGTANGVAYLNGSKVLTTGSALVFDGSGNLGLGVTPSAWFSGYKALETGSGSLVYPGTATNTQLWNNLYVNAAGNVTYKSTGIGGLYSIGGGGNAHTWYYAASGTAGTTATLTQAMTLDASGNLGIGTTSPTRRLDVRQAYTADTIVAQIGNTNNGNGATPVATIFDFTEANGTSVSRISSIYTQNIGKTDLAFGTYNSGLAEKMRLDFSGNLGIGSTSPIAKLDISGISTSQNGLRLTATSGGQALAAFTADTSTGEIRIGGTVAAAGNYFPVFYAAGTERARIDTSGNLGIGTTSPSTGKFSDASCAVLVQSSSTSTGTNIFSSNSNNTKFVGFWSGHSGAESAVGVKSGTALTFGAWAAIDGSGGFSEWGRFDSSGNLLVGATSTSGNVVQIYNNSSQAGRININKTTSGLFNAIANSYSGTYVGGVNYDNTTTSFPTSSDIRLKKDIVDAGSASAKIDQIRIVSHGWKHDDAVVEFGIVAQELVNVAPQAVSVGDDGEEIETTWGVDYSKLVPLLIKAHQEQQALITQLTARITALEGA